MDKIIEKLNKPNKMLVYSSLAKGGTCTYKQSDILSLTKKADEMLEALITFLIQMESIVTPKNTKYTEQYYDHFKETYSNLLKPVEKATGKSWEEIKELM